MSLETGERYEAVACSICGCLVPLWPDNDAVLRLTSPTSIALTCQNCDGRGEYLVTAIRSARFDGERLTLAADRDHPNSRDLSVFGLQWYGALKTGLFKYVLPARVDVLRNELIRYTPANQCNDRADSQPILDESAVESFVRINARKVVKTLFATPGFSFEGGGPKALEDCLIEIKKQLYGRLTVELPHRDKYGILSLTTSSLNPAMWAHYADDHRGFAIRFVTRRLTLPDQGCTQWDLGWAWPVIYRSDRHHSEESLDAAAVWFEKDPVWSYEKEWRIVRRLDDAKVVTEEAIHLFSMPSEAIAGVILGANANVKLRDEVMALAECDSKLHHLSIEQVTVDASGALRLETLRSNPSKGDGEILC